MDDTPRGLDLGRLVEVQMRTIAMDFWASTEHEIFYKYRDDVPQSLLDGLKDAAESAATLDFRLRGVAGA